MTSPKFDANKLVAVINAVLDRLIWVFALAVRMLRGEKLPEVAPTEDPQQRNKKRIIAAVSSLVILASLTSLCLTQCEPTYHMDLEPHRVVGETVAKEVSNLLSGRGELVILELGKQSQAGLPEGEEMEMRMKGFLQEIQEHKELSVAATEDLTLQEYQTVFVKRGFSSATFSAILQNHPRASAIISFVGPPDLRDEDIARLGQDIPKVITFSRSGSVPRKLLENGVIQLAIIPNTTLKPWEFKGTGARRDEFDRRYKIVTKETSSSLPY